MIGRWFVCSNDAIESRPKVELMVTHCPWHQNQQHSWRLLSSPIELFGGDRMSPRVKGKGLFLWTRIVTYQTKGPITPLRSSSTIRPWTSLVWRRTGYSVVAGTCAQHLSRLLLWVAAAIAVSLDLWQLVSRLFCCWGGSSWCWALLGADSLAALDVTW